MARSKVTNLDHFAHLLRNAWEFEDQSVAIRCTNMDIAQQVLSWIVNHNTGMQFNVHMMSKETTVLLQVMNHQLVTDPDKDEQQLCVADRPAWGAEENYPIVTETVMNRVGSIIREDDQR